MTNIDPFGLSSLVSNDRNAAKQRAKNQRGFCFLGCVSNDRAHPTLRYWVMRSIGFSEIERLTGVGCTPQKGSKCWHNSMTNICALRLWLREAA